MNKAIYLCGSKLHAKTQNASKNAKNIHKIQHPIAQISRW